MNFTERGQDVLSCSALPRVRACTGSFLLSKGCPDTESEPARDGQKIHDFISGFAMGQAFAMGMGDELYEQAWVMWGHAQKSAYQFFGQDAQLVWRSENRRWLANADLEPILSGQFDLTCSSEANPKYLLLYDFKSGFLAGDVPVAERNEQIEGMAAILQEETGLTVLAAIVRPWASDQLVEMRPEWVQPWVESVYEYTDPLEAGLKIGPHCRYCPAREFGKCPLHRDQLALVLKSDGLEKTMELMTPDNLVRILKASAPAEGVIEAAKKEAHRRREAGEELPGVLWEKGNTKRKIADEAKFGMKMLVAGIDLGAFQKTEIPIGSAYKAWVKHLKKKDNKETKDQFNRDFADCLEFSENAPSLTFPS